MLLYEKLLLMTFGTTLVCAEDVTNDRILLSQPTLTSPCGGPDLSYYHLCVICDGYWDIQALEQILIQIILHFLVSFWSSNV